MSLFTLKVSYFFATNKENKSKQDKTNINYFISMPNIIFNVKKYLFFLILFIVQNSVNIFKFLIIIFQLKHDNKRNDSYLYN